MGACLGYVNSCNVYVFFVGAISDPPRAPAQTIGACCGCISDDAAPNGIYFFCVSTQHDRRYDPLSRAYRGRSAGGLMILRWGGRAMCVYVSEDIYSESPSPPTPGERERRGNIPAQGICYKKGIRSRDINGARTPRSPAAAGVGGRN